METGASLGLKRRYEEVDDMCPFPVPKESDDDASSSDSVDSCDSLNPPSGSAHTPPSILRRHTPSTRGKRVRFDVVTVYYFPRRQGFTSVPSQGGSSLGMAHHHSSIRHYTLGEFKREQETSHRRTLVQHLRQEKLNARKMKLTRNGTVECAQADLLTLDDVSDEDVEGVEVDDCFFLQPLPTKRRRALLRASGIARIDAREKAELRAIRVSREECGCDCRLYCDPRHCGCSQAGIKCQVDRMSFPCGCSRDGCGNAAGRVEFNPLRVRTHYLHTIMKLDLEQRRVLMQGSGDAYVDPFPASSSPSSTCPASPDLSSLEGSEGLLVEQETLEQENETAVLHLQSAEEQERREREEAGVEQLLLQGHFPPGATVLCIADSQEAPPSELLKDSAPLLYYQLSAVEPGAFEDGGERGAETDEKHEEDASESLTNRSLCSAMGAGPELPNGSLYSAMGAEPEISNRSLCSAMGAEPELPNGSLYSAMGAEPEISNRSLCSAMGAEPELPNGSLYSAMGAEPEISNRSLCSAMGAEPELPNGSLYSAMGAEPELPNKGLCSAMGVGPELPNGSLYSAMGAEPELPNGSLYSAMGAEPELPNKGLCSAMGVGPELPNKGLCSAMGAEPELPNKGLCSAMGAGPEIFNGSLCSAMGAEPELSHLDKEVAPPPPEV